jgi:hypothetical protein
MNMAGLAKNYLGLYDQAIPWFRRSNEANRNYASAYFNLAASWRNLVDSMRRIPPSRLASRSTLRTPSRASMRPGRQGATIRPTWLRLSPFSKACAWRACGRGDRLPLATPTAPASA